MGVYHFMGLGLSPGAVTAAISYLADRYERYNEAGSAFFAASGEFVQETKRGDVQAIVLFTTSEVMKASEEGVCSPYVDNKPGYTRGIKDHGQPMPKVLKRVLPKDLKRAAGLRKEVTLFWCEIDHVDLRVTFERVARAMHAAKLTGAVGKEIWINLTGGTNVVNLTLQLAAALLGGPARLYYLNSADPCCLHHTTPIKDLGTDRDRFWIDIPALYMQFDNVARAILEVLEKAGVALDDVTLLGHLKSHPHTWNELKDKDEAWLSRHYLLPMTGQQLLRRVSTHSAAVGPQWEVLKSYYKVVADVRHQQSNAETSLEALAKNQPWFHHDTIPLS